MLVRFFLSRLLLLKVPLIMPRKISSLHTHSEWTIFVCTSNIGAHISIWLAAALCMSNCVWDNLGVLETAKKLKMFFFVCFFNSDVRQC